MALASLYEIFLGYSALFLCIGFGILFLRRAAGGVVGPEYWGAGLLLNSAGFLCWAATATDRPWLFFTAGEIFHMLGFVIMVGGAYRFTGNAFKRWNVYALFGFACVWAAAMLLVPYYGFVSFFLIMALRTILFVWAGCMMLKFTPSNRTAGRRLAGWSLIAWGVYVLLFPFFFQFPSLIHPAFGFLVGFHVLAALGLVVLVVDRVRVRAELVPVIHRIAGGDEEAFASFYDRTKAWVRNASVPAVSATCPESFTATCETERTASGQPSHSMTSTVGVAPTWAGPDASASRVRRTMATRGRSRGKRGGGGGTNMGLSWRTDRRESGQVGPSV